MRGLPGAGGVEPDLRAGARFDRRIPIHGRDHVMLAVMADDAAAPDIGDLRVEVEGDLLRALMLAAGRIAHGDGVRRPGIPLVAYRRCGCETP